MRRGERGAVLAGVEVAAGFVVARQVLAEYVGDRGEAVVGLVGGRVVDVGGVGEIGRLVDDVPGHLVRRRVVPPRERLTQRCGLNDPLVGELLVRRSDNAQTWRGAALTGETGRLRSKVTSVVILVVAIALVLLL